MRIFLLAILLISVGAGFLLAADDRPASSRQNPGFAVVPAAVPAPPDNPTTPAKVELGKQLFFDPRLSGGNDMSCATCHLPEQALTDGKPRAAGEAGKELPRNTLTIWDTGLHTSFFWDGRAATLEEQALIPIQSPAEMAQNLEELVLELAAIPGYARRFEAVFQRPVNPADIARAIAAFERTLLARNSPFDRFLTGDKSALSVEAQQGMEIFQRNGCARCHNGPLLSDGKFYRLSAGGTDHGREQATGNPDDRYKFRVPSLRNVAETGPYMHDGSERTLFDAVAFYFRHTPPGPGALPADIEPLLGQSYSEIDAIVEFLRSLTGEIPVVESPDLP